MDHPFDSLSPDTVVDSIEALGLRCDLRMIALNSYENRVYQVGIEDATPIIAKFYRPERWTTAQILEEHAFAAELVDADLSVVAPMTIGGQTLHEVGDFRIAVFERRGGHAPELDNFDSLLILGRTLGRIHRVGAAKRFKHRRSLDIDTLVSQSREFISDRFITDDLKLAYDSLARDLEAGIRETLADYSPDDHIRLHGDCHVGNILWRDDVAHFVDLDDCCNGPAIQDLWMFLSGDRFHQEQQLSEVIAGYEEFMDFAPRQLRWIEALRAMRLMHYAAWLGRRWSDPAFPRAFPWFGQARFWSDHILELREQLAMLNEPPLRLL
ncbi:aminoglycoside phosphotransferase [Luminiphilus syltensis NOR5-1B]|uniref:Stress response kinase A n=1 Tax=Luminiphilus syltensis NOR5-1B TaxID=565045 RepID=B8KUU9_9GAMM|nr:serine/threonine protein kinase [Luminiphilus syltensis]EED35583.1 aminoglycoside phosphotransferase [Luminiphilus syltensis NOR5-1B]